MRMLLLILVAISYLPLNGQYLDDFQEPSWPDSVVWIGDRGSFLRDNGQLRLFDNASGGTGLSQLMSPILLPRSLTWSSGCFLDFSPSSSNYACLVIYASAPSLEDSDNALWARIGGQSGSTDFIGIYARIDGTDSLLMQTNPGSAAVEPHFAIRAFIDSSRLWVFIDSAQTGLQFLDSCALPILPENGFTGYWCRYSSTRSDKMYFDPIQITPKLRDRISPTVVQSDWMENGHFSFSFSEAINFDSLQVSVSAGTLDSVDEMNAFKLSLRIDSLHSPVRVAVSLKNMIDLWGNSKDTTVSFEFYRAKPNDVIVTEIHARPDSFMAALPPAEFVEIFNRSDFSISLSGWYLQDELDYRSENSREFSPAYLPPKTAAIICSKSDSALFASFGLVMPLASFPNLNQGSDWIILKNQSMEQTHASGYHSACFGDDYRSEGGFSLERKSNSECSYAHDFSISDNPFGGSPGTWEWNIPASYDSIPFRPRYKRMLGDSIMSVDWPLELMVDSTFRVSWTGSENPSWTVPMPFRKSLTVLLPEKPSGSEIVLLENLSLCDGRRRSFEIPIQPVSATPALDSLRLSEVMFNPVSSGADYIEIQNHGSELIALNKFLLVEADLENTSQWTGFGRIDLTGLVIEPDSILFFCSNCRDAISGINQSDTFRCVQIDDMINLPDNGAWLGLFDSSGIPLLIDSAGVRSSFHHPLIRVEDGIALERKNPFAIGKSSHQWTSAPWKISNGSPGLRNLNTGNDNLGSDSVLFSIQPVWINPLNGFDAFSLRTISDDPETVAFLDILTEWGSPVLSLLDNDLIGLGWTGSWDGFGLNGEILPSGNYILRLQTLSPAGARKVSVKTVALRY